MTCQNCQLYRDHQITRAQANCIFDGARMIQRIQALEIPTERKSKLCWSVVAEWVAWGHDEQEIRQLAKGPTALEPLEISEKKGKR